MGFIFKHYMFKYYARDDNGKPIYGAIEAIDEDDAVSQLQARGLFVLSVNMEGATEEEELKVGRGAERRTKDRRIRNRRIRNRRAKERKIKTRPAKDRRVKERRTKKRRIQQRRTKTKKTSR